MIKYSDIKQGLIWLKISGHNPTLSGSHSSRGLRVKSREKTNARKLSPYFLYFIHSEPRPQNAATHIRMDQKSIRKKSKSLTSMFSSHHDSGSPSLEQACSQSKHDPGSPSLGLPPQVILYCGMLTTKRNHHSHNI